MEVNVGDGAGVWATAGECVEDAGDDPGCEDSGDAEVEERSWEFSALSDALALDEPVGEMAPGTLPDIPM